MNEKIIFLALNYNQMNQLWRKFHALGCSVKFGSYSMKKDYSQSSRGKGDECVSGDFEKQVFCGTACWLLTIFCFRRLRIRALKPLLVCSRVCGEDVCKKHYMHFPDRNSTRIHILVLCVCVLCKLFKRTANIRVDY